ncbi:hypothetical protein ACP70R_047872 [Stipagrostis hirtigluma subsp. patula]
MVLPSRTAAKSKVGCPREGSTDDPSVAASATPQIRDMGSSAKRFLQLHSIVTGRFSQPLWLLLVGLTSCCIWLCIDQQVSAVSWISSLFCLYMFFRIASMSVTMSTVEVFLRVSYLVLIACVASYAVSPFAGMVVLYLNTIYSAGLLGYAFAERRFLLITKKYAVDVPAAMSQGARYFMSFLSIVCGVKMLSVCYSYAPGDASSAVSELSVTLCISLSMWTWFIHMWLLDASVISFDDMFNLFYIIFLGFYVLLFTFCGCFGEVGIVFACWLTAMVISGVLGYSIAINDHLKQLQLARTKALVMEHHVVAKKSNESLEGAGSEKPKISESNRPMETE